MRTRRFASVLVLLSTSLFAQQSQPPVAKDAVTEEAGKPPLHPATADQVREFLSLQGTERITQELMSSSVKAMQATAAPYYPASFFTDLADAFQKIDVTALDIPIYQKYVSQEEMASVISFYRSPAGRKLLALQPVLTSEAKVLMRAKGAEIGAAVYAKHKDEIEAAKKKYEGQQSKGPQTEVSR